MVLSTNQRLEMQTGIKDKTQDKPCTLRSISSQKEALYLYRVNFRFTGPRLNYSPEGGHISKGGLLTKQVRIQHSTLARRKLTFFFIFIFYFIILLDFIS